MDMRPLLLRSHKVEQSEGHSHKIRNVHVRPGQFLAPGDGVCSLEYKRSRLIHRSSSDTVYVAECVFDVDKYGTVQVLDVAATVGQELPEDGCVLFSYAVPANLENALEGVLDDLVCDVSNLHSSHSVIPGNKREAAIDEYANGVSPDRILFLYDDTTFGTAKTGFVITDSALYLHSDDASCEVRYNRIASWAQTEAVVPRGKGDSVLAKNLTIFSDDNDTTQIPHTAGMLDWANADRLFDALIALRREGKTKDVDGPIVIEDLPDETKLAYVAAIVWLVHHDGASIDVKGFGELRLLMTQLNFSGELRRRTLAMMDDAENVVLDRILERLNDQAPTGAERLIAFSLAKDVVRVFKSVHGDEAPVSPRIAEACRLLDVGDDQLRVILEAVEFDRKVLDGKVSSDELKKVAEGLASKAAAVGVPIAAVYISGSVVGLSAAGMTSGLAALGFGGLLGLSSMATGIGVAVLLGLAAYKGVQWVTTGNKDKERTQLRDLMLHEVLRNHQKAIAALGEDLAYFARKIVELSRDVLENKLRIEKLGQEVTLFAEALTQLKLRGEAVERELGTNQTQDSSGESNPAPGGPDGDAS